MTLGRISSITEVKNGESEEKSYKYDLLGRITEVKLDNIVTESYTYDENGNRLSGSAFDYAQSPEVFVTKTATYDNEDRMLTYGDNSYTYNSRGTMLSKSTPNGVTTYSYDSYDTLKSVTLPDNRVITYETDIYDRRVIKKVDGEITRRYVYQDELNISQELDAQGNVETQYIYGLRANIPEYMVRGGVEYKIISDHLGSPIMIVNTRDNSVVKSIKYDSFGNIIEESGAFSLPFRFAGGIWDEDTKLIRFGVRDYDSETGRWTSKEPLGFSGARNWYVYAGNDGVNYVDVNGLLEIFVGRKDGFMAIAPTDGEAGNLFFIDITTGRGDYINKPLYEQVKNKGPIPKGEYYALSNELSDHIGNFKELTLLKLLKHLTRLSRGDWGRWRLILHPKNLTNTFGRDGFFIHGGFMPGSAGCIDIGGGMMGDKKTSKLKEMILNDKDGYVEIYVY